MASVKEIRGLVLSYLLGAIKAKELAGAISPIYRTLIDSGDHDAYDLSLRVDAQMSRYFAGYTSEDALRSALVSLAPPSEALQVAVASWRIDPRIASQTVPVLASGSLSPRLNDNIPVENPYDFGYSSKVELLAVAS